MKRLRRQDRGFTLIEVVLAVALCALVMTLIYGILVSTIDAAGRIEELTHGSEIGPAILSLIREDVGAAFLPGDDQDFFVGQERGGKDRLDFVSSSAVFAAETSGAEPKIHSINEIGYQVKEDSEGVPILYRRVDPFVDAEPLRGGRLIALAPVTQFKVTYWTGKEWVPTWVSSKAENKLPTSVRIEMKLRVPDRRAEGGTAERAYSTIIPLAK